MFASIAIRLAVFGVLAATALKARPSTLLRVAEDVVVDGVTGIAQGTKGFVRRTKVEYHARMLDKAQRAVEREDKFFETATPEQRNEALRDAADVLARAHALGQARKSKARRASHSGHEAFSSAE